MFNTGYDTSMSPRERYEAKKKQIIKWAIKGIVGIIALIIIGNSFTIIKPGYHGVKYSFGTLHQEEVGQGFKLHWPWQDIQPYATSTEVEKRLIEKNDEGKITDDNSIQLNTNDGKSVKVAFTYNYKFQPDRLDHIFTKFRRKTGPEISDQFIDQQIINRGQAISTTHSVLQIYSQKRAQINAEWYEILKSDLEKDGIVLEEFTIVDVIPDKETLVILQQIADEENKRELVKRQRQTLVEAELNIEQQNKNDKKAAEGAKDVAIVNAEKKAQETLIQARAQADANKELELSLTPVLIEYETILAWKAGGSQVPKIMGESGNIINVPSSLLGE